MPTHIKMIARLGNGVACLLWLLLFIGFIGAGRPVGALFMCALLALSLFNIYVIEKCIRYFAQGAGA